MNSLFKNSVFNFLSQAVIFLSAAILSIFLARLLGPAQMGLYSYWVWLIGTGALIFTLGIPRSLIRYVAQYKSEITVTQIISRTFFFQLKLLSLFTVLSLAIVLFIGEGERSTYSIVIITLSVTVINNILGSALFGLQKYNLLLRLNLFAAPLLLSLTLAVLFFNKSLNNLLLVNLMIAVVSVLISSYYLKNFLKLNAKKIPGNIYAEMKKYTFLISIIIFLDLILMDRSEIFFLKNFSTLEQVAFYSIGFGLVGRVMTLIPGAVSGVIMPKIARLHGNRDSENIKLTYFNSTRYLMMITLPIVLGGITLADLPVRIFYGNDYLSMVPVIQILLISGGLSAIVAASAAVLYGTGGQNFILKLAVVLATINIILDLILIPSFGAIGAAFANSTAQILGFISGVYYLTGIKKMPFPWKDGSKILLACVFAAFTVYFLKILLKDSNLLVLLFITVTSFIVLYTLGLILSKFFSSRDKELLIRVTNKIPYIKNLKLWKKL